MNSNAFIRGLFFYTLGEYTSAIVPANVAVESKVFGWLTEILSEIVGKKRTRAFLEDAATYSHQMNVLLPFIAHYRGQRTVPEHIRGRSNQLQAIRNEVAHRGMQSRSLSKTM